MATTQQEIDDGNKDFGAAFDEDTADPVEQTEDEAFGLNLPDAADGAAEGDGETDGNTVVVESGDPEAIPTAGAEELPVEPPAEEVAAAEAEAEAGDDAMPPMTQAEKSWDGRLRAREAELKALAAELDARKNSPADPIESSEDPAEEASESPAEESGEGSADEADEAMRQLSEDFGPEFVKMICSIAAKKAAEAAGGQVDELGKTVKEVIDDIKDSRNRRHFKEIFKEHPDFADIAESEGFKSFVAAMAPAEKVEAERIVERGDSDEINGLLSEFKNSTSPTGGDESELDAAEGVRSTGMRLPTSPDAGSDDFAAAWDEHS